MLIPYSKPRTASSDSGLLHTWTHKDNTTHEMEQFTLFTRYVRIFTSRKLVCSGLMWLRGMYMSLVSWHTTMTCRWLNVPLPTSCPLMRILKPATRYSNLNIDVTLKKLRGKLSVFVDSSNPFWTYCCKRCLRVDCRQRVHLFWVDCNEVKYLYLSSKD